MRISRNIAIPAALISLLALVGYPALKAAHAQPTPAPGATPVAASAAAPVAPPPCR
jgi:hypothetical protein